MTVEEQARALITKELGTGENDIPFPDSTPLKDIADSLDLVNFMVQVEDEFELPYTTNEEIAKLYKGTLADLLKYIVDSKGTPQ